MHQGVLSLKNEAEVLPLGDFRAIVIYVKTLCDTITMTTAPDDTHTNYILVQGPMIALHMEE